MQQSRFGIFTRDNIPYLGFRQNDRVKDKVAALLNSLQSTLPAAAADQQRANNYANDRGLFLHFGSYLYAEKNYQSAYWPVGLLCLFAFGGLGGALLFSSDYAPLAYMALAFFAITLAYACYCVWRFTRDINLASLDREEARFNTLLADDTNQDKLKFYQVWSYLREDKQSNMKMAMAGIILGGLFAIMGVGIFSDPAVKTDAVVKFCGGGFTAVGAIAVLVGLAVFLYAGLKNETHAEVCEQVAQL